MRNRGFSGTAGIAAAISSIRRRLPPGWLADLRRVEGGGSALHLEGLDGRGAELPLVARRSLLPRDVSTIVRSLPRAAVVVTPFLSGRTRELLAESGVSYVDETGNMRLVVSSPAIFLEGIGADKQPQAEPRPLKSLRGAAAGRVVRSLCEIAPPFGVRELAQASASPLGTVSRVISFLEDEALVSRDTRRQIGKVDRAALLVRWSNDYSVVGSNVVGSYLEPRGLGALWPKLARLPRYAATGSIAARTRVAPTRLAMIYVDEPDAAAETLGLVPADSGANVWLLRPYDPVVFERLGAVSVDSGSATSEIVVVSEPQAIVDLKTSPGRGPQEADALLEQMKGADDARGSPP